MDYFTNRHEQDLDGAKPGWGDHQKMYDALGLEGPMLMSDEPGVPIGEERAAKRKDGIAWLRARGK